MIKAVRTTVNIVIVILVLVGVFIMLHNQESATGLTASGWANLKYYTVLSNLFAGIVAVGQIIAYIRRKLFQIKWKLAATTAVALTFLVVAGFFGPLYGWLPLYQGSNLFFHLIVPVLCIIEFCVSWDGQKIPICYCVFASLSTVIYGFAYLINLWINGVGKWPESNDWYGFLNWGYGMGITVFFCIVLTSFGIACLLRFIWQVEMSKTL